MGVLPAFHSLRYGLDAIEVYHDRSECHIGRLILDDDQEAFGEGGRPRCAECRKYGAPERVIRN